jgi:hypothetical protein
MDEWSFPIVSYRVFAFVSEGGFYTEIEGWGKGESGDTVVQFLVTDKKVFT